MTDIADIHCHILPYVDDGAVTKEESRRLVDMQYSQGVRTICATPHLRLGMFETSDEAIKDQFEKLKERTLESGLSVRLFLSREYYCDKAFIKHMEAGRLIPMGNSRHILTEFSHGYSGDKMLDYAHAVIENGYRPLIAHLERYPAVAEDPDIAQRLIELGAKIQMNAGSIIGFEGRRQQSLCKKLLKQHLVYVVASDAHDSDDRPPQLAECSKYLERKFGEEYARQLLCEDPLEILGL